uniref:Uncharacterized protein n=1 Tax=Desertifilum tharense IPPAS B-1220 TaxID=1781255 RepID=A0ACD5GY82_9CYAN
MTDSSSLNSGDRPSLDILNLADCDRALFRWMVPSKTGQASRNCCPSQPRGS